MECRYHDYGDKAPETLGGRIVAFIWMFSAIILISSLTAGISGALTVKSLEHRINNIHDYNRFSVGSVGSVPETGPSQLLDRNRITYTPFNEIKPGIKAVHDKKIDFFIYDKPIMEYYIEELGVQDEVVISSDVLRTDYYSFMYPQNSNLVKVIDPLLVEVIKNKSLSEL